MPANNVINAFMAGRQFRQDQDDRQRAIGLENTRGKVNALLMQPDQPGAGFDAGGASGEARGPSNLERARQMVMGSGDAELMGQFRQQVAAMDEQQRARQQQLFGLVGQVANSLRGVETSQRGQALMSMAPQLRAAGAPDEEIMRYAQLLSDPQSSDAIIEALSSRVLEAQSVFDAYAPQMQGESEVLSRFQGGRQVQGPVNPNAPINQGIDRYQAETGRMNANTARGRLDLDSQQSNQPDWVTLPPGDPRRAGFDDSDVVQYNVRTGQVARRSQDRVFNATESQAAGFAGRMNDAAQIIQSVESQEDFNGVPEFLWNRPTRTLPPEWQRYRQAGENWIRANLRRESGAVIGVDEMASEFRVYFPQPGDSPEVIRQKANARARAEQSMRAQSRGAYEDYGLDQPVSQPAQAQETTATNPQTGERIVLRNGRWEPM